jgi:hypothetical protein
MEVAGKVKLIDTTKEVGSSNFKKRDLVITTLEQYPQDILIQFVQDKCEVLDKFKVGENVVISINLRGREWVNPQGETVYFNTIQGWMIKHGEQSSEATPNVEPEFAPAPKQVVSDVEDDLPF